MLKSGIKNMIFDFGGVILEISHQRVEQAFRDMGMPNFDEVYSKATQAGLFKKFETGEISPQKFRSEIKKYISRPVTDSEIDATWNKIIVGFPAIRIEMLRSLAANFNLFLLSNTNIIHFIKYTMMFKQKFGYDFSSLFIKTYWSFQIGLRKPDPEVYEHVLNDSRLTPGETLFIDDTEKNLPPAANMGIKTLLINPEENVVSQIHDYIQR